MNEELSYNKNIGKAIIMTTVQTILFVAILSLTYSNDNSVIVAQVNDNGTTTTDSSISNQVSTSADNNANLNNDNDKDNFNIEGTITSIVMSSNIEGSGMTTSNQSLTPTPNSNIPSQTNILGGKWRIDVVKENVEYFKANITMITSTGTDMHNHLIEFKPNDTGTTLLSNNTAIVSPNTTTVEIAALNSSVDNNITSISRSGDNSIMFSGISDIITNGVIEWKDVPTSVSIFNDNVLKVELDPKIVNNHFSDIPIYGLVNSVEPIKVIQNGTDVNNAVS
jgi:hypothetical protein